MEAAFERGGIEQSGTGRELYYVNGWNAHGLLMTKLTGLVSILALVLATRKRRRSPLSAIRFLAFLFRDSVSKHLTKYRVIICHNHGKGNLWRRYALKDKRLQHEPALYATRALWYDENSSDAAR